MWFSYSPVDGHLACFLLLAVVNNAAVNVGVQVALGDPAFSSFECTHGSGVARSCCSSIFNFLRSLCTVF